MSEQSEKNINQLPAVDLEAEMLTAASALASSNPEQFLDELDWSVAENFDVMDPDTMHHGMAQPFHDCEWYESWLSTTGKNAEIRILVGRFANMEMIILPLCLQKSGPFTTASFIAGDVSDYNHPIFHKALAGFVSPTFFEAMWCKITPMIGDADTLSLRKLLLDPGQGCGKALWQSRRLELESSHHTNLTGNWTESQGRFFGKSSRRSLSRKEKKISAVGEISFVDVRETDARIRAIETLSRWKSLQLRNLGLANPFIRGDFRQFLTRIARNGDPDVYRIYCMYAGDTPLSITLMICRNGRWFLYQTAYTDQEAGKFSPGMSLLREVLKRAHDEGCKIFDFGLGNEGYKKKYCDQELTLYRSEIALSAKGWLAKAYFDAEQGTRTLVKSNAKIKAWTLSLLQLVAGLKRQKNQENQIGMATASVRNADFNSTLNGYDISKIDMSTPVLILGGKENSLSLTRRFGTFGIKTRVSGPTDCWGMYSRHCSEHFKIPHELASVEFWKDLLLSGKNTKLHGSLLIACSDVAIEFLAENHAELNEYFVFAHGDPKLQLSLLDKRETLILAKNAGVATPQFWNVENEEDLEAVRETVTFPVMVKPILSHKFIKVFGKKLFIIDKDFDQLTEKVRLAWAKDIEVMVIEMIPGPDSQLSSYYTYIDDSDQVLFEYTKRIIRRYPTNRGLACYHKSEWMPETAEAGKKFFEGIGFTGLGNIEFKRDPRDNVLKVIECNARFTAAQELVVQAGAPIDLIYYCVATGQPAPVFKEYDQQLTYWYGLRDFLAFLEMRKAGSISTDQWIKSLFPLKHVPPLHRLSDPYPSFAALSARVDKTVRSLM